MLHQIRKMIGKACSWILMPSVFEFREIFYLVFEVFEWIAFALRRFVIDLENLLPLIHQSYAT